MKESGMILELTRLSEACAEGVAKELQPGLEPAALHVYVGIITCSLACVCGHHNLLK